MENELRKHFPAVIVMLVILLLGSCYLFSDSMQSFPAYVHSWTQTDRLALAQNFQLNGFDFFHPTTYSLLTKDGITQVDFPIHDYLVACISSLLNADIISVFRWYNLLYSLLGLFFFFRLTLILTGSAARSIFASCFLFTLPFFVYYENGFLPSVPSYANFCIGLYFLVKYKLNSKTQYQLLASLFLTLAALARAPFIIFLFAYLLLFIKKAIQTKKLKGIEVIPPAIGILIFVGYSIYNQFLASKYGSMFLSELLYFESFNDFIETLSIAAERWGNQLLSPFHSILLVLLLCGLIYQLGKQLKLGATLKYLSLFFIASAAGVLLFFFAFGKQFAEHDYYYIDSFLPLLSVLLLLAFMVLKIPRKWYTLSATLCIIFFFYFFSYAKTIQSERYTPPHNDRTEYAYKVYANSKDDLKNWGIKNNDTLLVLDANTTNMPFTIWGNRGYTSLNSSKEKVKAELDSPYTYVVLLDSFFISSSFAAFPELVSELKLIHTNNELSVYQKSKSGNPADFFENLIYYGYSDFDNHTNIADSVTAWTPKSILTEEKGNSLKIEARNEYTLSWKIEFENVIPDKPIEVLFLADYFSEDSTTIQIVNTVNNYYSPRYLENELTELGVWKKQLYHYKIDPKYLSEKNKLGFYFWNPNKNELYVDNVTLLIYQ